MDFYKLADGTLVGTQADARKSKQKWTPHAVPTDKQGLMDYLNRIAGCQKAGATRDSGPEAYTDTSPAPPNAPRAVSVGRDMSAKAMLARIDAPEGVDVDKIGEIILKSNGYVLASFAEAVAMRYGMLAKSRS
jgi:hypothetical protein